MVSSISLYFVVVNLNKKAIAIDAAADDVLPRLQRDPANGGPPRGRRQEPRPHREFAQLETRRSVAFGQVKKNKELPPPSPKKIVFFSQILRPSNGPEVVPEPPPNEEHVHFCRQNELELSAIYWLQRQRNEFYRFFFK